MKRILCVIAAAVIPAVLWSMAISPSFVMVFSLMDLFLCVYERKFIIGFRLGVLYGFVLYAISLSWLWQIFSAPAVALWMILALFPGLACGGIAWVSRRWRNALWLPVYVAVLWTGVEYFRCEWFTLRFPWMTAGTAFAPIAVTPWIGVYGVTFLVALLASLMLMRKQGWRSWIAPVVIVILLSVRIKDIPEGTSAEAIPVMAVQSENCDFFTYYDRSKESDFRNGIFLWPEYATMEDTRTSVWGRDKITALSTITELAREREATIIFGQKRNEGDALFNEALTVDGSGILGSHDKNRPVHFMNDGTPGKTTLPVQTRWGRIGTPICFDNDYTEIPRRMVAAGAQVFLTPSMDAERWTRRQHWQHGELFRLRAAETSRWYLVCSTSGVTQRIGPDGRRHDQLPLMEDGILRTTVYARDEMTFYVRYGWMFPYVVSFSAVLWSIGLWIAGRKRRGHDPRDVPNEA
jgi:apolipoprotein N-acyltransferase